MCHAKELSQLNGHECRVKGQNLKPFTGNGDDLDMSEKFLSGTYQRTVKISTTTSVVKLCHDVKEHNNTTNTREEYILSMFAKRKVC